MNRGIPKVSVIVPVYNCRETILKCLNSLVALEHPSFEVIIVDDGSTDGTAEICEAFSQIRLIKLSRGGPSRARNTGISQAQGELIAFTDGDCVVDKRWLTELESAFDGPEIVGVGGDQRSPDDETMMGSRIQEFLKQIGFMTGYIKTASIMQETEHNPSCNAMYRKAVLEEVGGFDEALFPGEDVELDLKLRRRGWRLIYNPAAVVSHYRPKNYTDFAAMMRRYGASQRYLVKKYGFFRRLHFVPPILAASLVLLIAAIIWRPEIWPIVVLAGLVVPVWFCVKTKRFGKALRFSYLFLLTVVSWNLGFLGGYISMTESKRELNQ
ncbi:MAG TPA: glycosyltransferase [Desulfomonilaceae bacterium]|nr:glycosyltransferase [Desulfomonilaceae bacterium]